MRGNPHVRFGPEAAGKGPAPCRHLAGVLPVLASTTISARSSSSSAPTSRTTPSCASTATSGPNGRPPRPGSGSPRSTTGSPPSTIRRRCRPICDRLGAEPRSTRCCASGWPFCRTRSPPTDRAAGYRYELSILQAEFSLTQMLDKPVSGRMFFEQVIRDNLDIGRPDQVALVFDRKLIRRGPRPHRDRSVPG